MPNRTIIDKKNRHNEDYYDTYLSLVISRLRLSDDQVWQEIIKIAGVTCSSDFQKIDKTKQREALGLLRELGASVRQLERLTGISRGVIQFVRK